VTATEWVQLGLAVVGTVFGLLALTGVLLLPAAASATRLADAVDSSWERTTGEVVEVARTRDPGGYRGTGGRTLWYPVTEQSVDGERTQKDWKAYVARDEGTWTVGEELPLRYDPQDPGHIVIDTAGARDLLDRREAGTSRLLVVGLAVAAPVVAAEVARRRWWPSEPERRRQRARERGRARARAERRRADLSR